MAKLAIVSERTVRDIVTRAIAYDAIRAAFEAVAVGRSSVFDVVIGTGLNDGEAFAIKSGLDRENEMVGFKCGTYWAGNHKLDVPAHGSTILLLDPETGFPKALIGASYLNGYRTAAANAVATDFLARKDASVLGVIGAGQQAEQEIRALLEIRQIERIKVFTRSGERASDLSARLQDIETDIRFTTAENAVAGSDIVTTVTPSTTALVKKEWLEPGMHVSAMGADDVGKHELEAGIALHARLFADYPAQSIIIGEFQHAHREGLIDGPGEISAIGLVTLGKVEGRTSDEEITVFDSSGIAIQDLAAAGAILQAAESLGQIQTVEL